MIVGDIVQSNRRTPEDVKRAASVLPKLRAGESALMGKMSLPQQREYSALASTLDPIGQLALIQMMAEGTLEQKDSRGGTLLSTLSALATTTPLAQDIHRANLVSQLVLELAQPASIDQESKNTCGATTVAILLASTRPAEYGRIVAGLAAPSGSVELVGGTLKRLEGTTQEDGSNRSIPQRLLAPALMDLGNGRKFGYQNAADKNTLAGIPLFSGALPNSVSTMLEAVLGGNVASEGGLLFHANASAKKQMEEAVNGDVPVPTLMEYVDSASHWVLSTAVDEKTVSFVNPWGREEVMPREEFDRRVKAFVFTDLPNPPPADEPAPF